MKRYRNSSDELYGMLELMEERFFKWIPSKEYKYYLEEKKQGENLKIKISLRL